ncbi:hypothetical protein PGT21_023681 [Puccinia graminis f. sp. tritici]|uniref:Superoxide dismutase copper/zinc binding domain-containing protein n=1 Tax=Puccinia graminis f. sp. tritici TaxID=56615 RepID=A0A5B0M1V8_PUCGR|nr:hypothetical protein PGT21_023681 [Puccinia graminis f. sp. tritici]
MAHTIATYIFWSLLIVGQAFSLSSRRFRVGEHGHFDARLVTIQPDRRFLPITCTNIRSLMGIAQTALLHYKVPTPKPSCTSGNQKITVNQPSSQRVMGNLPGLVDVFTLRINDNLIDLTGPNSIIGKSIVVHWCEPDSTCMRQHRTLDPWRQGLKKYFRSYHSTPIDSVK